MNINVTIVPNDIDKIVKIVFFNNKREILMLKRNENLEKHPNEWDLPGGHLRKGEKHIEGLMREVKEETEIINFEPTYYKKQGNKIFYFAELRNQIISLSHEHKEYKFFSAEQLNSRDNFQKIAIEVLERIRK